MGQRLVMLRSFCEEIKSLSLSLFSGTLEPCPLVLRPRLPLGVLLKLLSRSGRAMPFRMLGIVVVWEIRL